MKNIYILLLIFNFSFSYSQDKLNDTIKESKLKLFGGFESNSQWYQNDKQREINASDVTKNQSFRSNNYFQLNANFKEFTAGIQIESYEPNALLNYNPGFNGTDLALYFINYKSKKIDFTVGHFYEQFGSGLILRTWEDRALGINNALRGAKLKYSPIESVNITGIYGRQRTGFHVTQSDIYAVNTDLNVASLFKKTNFELSTGFSLVAKSEEIDPNLNNPKFDKVTKAFSGRINFAKDNFYFFSEYNFKDKEPLLVVSSLDYDFVKTGNAFLINTGFSKKGLGIDLNLRRVENFALLSERQPEVYAPEISSLFFNDRILNFVPALTKQHHSNLANIYVYQAQNRVAMQFDENIEKFGEIGGQMDIFYEFKKGTILGGKYGTKVSLNFSNWFNLKANYSYENSLGDFEPNYKTSLFEGREKYFSDYNIEVSKKFSSSFKGNFMFSNQFYNDQYIRGIFQDNIIKTNILFAEGIYNFSGYKSITISGEHMWADNDRGNWASLLVEYNHNQNWSVFFMDMYNYGFDENSNNVLIAGHIDEFDIHFYNVGGAYKKGSTRIALNYGRQRGGLVCAGGVCRFVPPSTGLGLTLTTTF